MNLIDWSGNNLLAVALNREVYLWNAVGAEISELMSMDEDSEPDSPLDEYITSTAWIQDSGPIIAVGNSTLGRASQDTCEKHEVTHGSCRLFVVESTCAFIRLKVRWNTPSWCKGKRTPRWLIQNTQSRSKRLFKYY